MAEVVNSNGRNQLERQTEKKDYEKDKALLEVEREYQKKLLLANADYTKKIQKMYDEINSVRTEYEQKMHNEVRTIRVEYEQKIEQLKQNKQDKK